MNMLHAYSQHVSLRHSRKANIVYLDGHAGQGGYYELLGRSFNGLPWRGDATEEIFVTPPSSMITGLTTERFETANH